MVFVNAKQSEINKYIGKKLNVEEIKETLVDLGMDLKGESKESDPELKIEITAEKMDMISAVGVARAIKYYKGFETKLPKYSIKKSDKEVFVKSGVEKVRPKVVAALLKDVPMSQEILDEIIKIQEKMHDSFGRNRKKAAIGIYPMDTIKFPITYSAEKPENIKFKPLLSEVEMTGFEILESHETGKKFKHLLENKSHYPVWMDSTPKVLSLAPIINSYETGRVETHHTNLFIEASGHNLTHLDNVLKTLVTTFVEMGAKAESVKVHYPNKETYELNLDSREEIVSLNYINKLIGIELTQKEIKKLASKVMYNISKIEEDKITFELPCFKTDVWYDCDIADDIARAYGYNNIIPKFPQIATIGSELEHTNFRNNIRDQMANLGFLELYTYMLTGTKEQYKEMSLDKQNHISIEDSAEEGINMTRTWILPENLKSLTINRKNKYPQKVFECGFTIQKDKTEDTKARNELHLSISIADPISNYTLIKEVFDVLNLINNWNLSIKDKVHPSFIEGRCASIHLGDKEVGVFGELHPQVLENFKLIVPVASLELNLENIFKKRN